MNFQDHVALVLHTDRLRSAAAAITACSASLNDHEQVFDYAGQRFTGADARCLKDAFLRGLGEISDDAQAALVAGGVVFPDPPPVAVAEVHAVAA